MTGKSWLLGLLLGLLCLNQAWAQDLTPERKAAHAVWRLSFGPTPGEIDRVKTMGVAAYLREQLTPTGLADPPELHQRLAPLKTQGMDAIGLFRTFGPKARGGAQPTEAELKSARARAAIIQQEAAQAKLWRALLSKRQLEELLTDFWFNHFNVAASKSLDHLWVGAFEREAIRPHVLGKFEDMLQAATRHPAMLIFLDNWQSASQDSAFGKGKSRPLLEVHAKELLTSHTMGANAHPKPSDINALARILAGWTIGAPRTPLDKNGVAFDERRHDTKDKVLLGVTIKGGGASETDEAIHLLAQQPATAANICAKLTQFFLAEDAPKPLLDRLAALFLSSNGDIRAVLTALFDSPEFWDAKYAASKYKTPLRAMVSTLRAAGRPVTEVDSLAATLADMNMPLYDAKFPSGYKDARDTWLTSEIMLKQLLFADRAGAGLLPCWGATGKEAAWQYQPSTPLDAASLAATMGITPSVATGNVLDACSPRIKAGVLLGSPEGLTY